MLARLKEQGKKHAIGKALCVGEPLVEGNEDRGRGKACLRGTPRQPQIVRMHDNLCPACQVGTCLKLRQAGDVAVLATLTPNRAGIRRYTQRVP